MKVKREVCNRVDKALAEYIESHSPEEYRMAAETLLDQWLKEMDYIGNNTYAKSSLVTHVEYRLFVLVEHKVFYDGVPQKLIRKPILGLDPFSAAAFCAWLTQRDRDRKWHYRLPRIEESDQIRLVEGKCYWAISGKDYCPIWIEKPVIPEVIHERIASELKEFPDLAKIYDFAQACALNFNQAIEFIGAYGFGIIGSEELGNFRAIALDDARRMAFSSNHILTFVGLITNNQVKDSDSARKYTKNLILEIIKGVALVFIALSIYLFSLLNQNFGGAFGAVIALYCIFKLFHDLSHKFRISQSFRKSLAIAYKYSLNLDTALKVYAAAVILEERSKGNLPAHEGICFVKERKPQHDAYSKTH